jgi:threonine-phosphate decarboxylase
MKRNNLELRHSNYSHGGDIYSLAEMLGIEDDRIMDFSASVNPLGISTMVKKGISRNLNALVHYPDPDAKALRLELARHHNIAPENIICGNGSTELIYLIPRAMKPKKVLIPQPTFSEYERACKISSKLKVQSYKLEEGNNFAIDPDKFISKIKKFSFNSKLKTQNSKLIFLCNPNNPTGLIIKKDDMIKIASAAKKMKCYLIVDEAFMDFCPEQSVINEVGNNPYLMVLRSMTKFYALTGLRIGYGIFPASIASKLKRFKEPWAVSTLAQKAGIIALGETGYRDKTIGLIKKEKQFLENNFKKIGIKFYPSKANFYLLKVNNADEIYRRLGKKGILVRNCSNFKGLDSSYIRIAVKSRRYNMRFLKELSQLCME